jgi:uncharacterized protein YodC (DUF2158 family)
MVVIGKSSNNVKCRWMIEGKSEPYTVGFYPQELLKHEDIYGKK